MSAPRDLATVLLRWGRLSLVFDPRDLWLGVYVGQDAVFVCLVPCLPARWARKKPNYPTSAN